MLQIQTAPGRLRKQKPAPLFGQRRGQRLPISYNFWRREQEVKIKKNERGFCGEMETEMEKTMEQIENILERATLDQLKIILRFLRHIIK